MGFVKMLALAGGGLLQAACGGGKPNETAASPPQVDSSAAGIAGDSGRDAGTEVMDTAAAAMMRDAAGRELGRVSVRFEDDLIRVWGNLTGLPPGEHGFHIHTVGRCDPPFETAGPHWNPANRQHGRQNPNGSHEGDLNGFIVGSDGVGHVNDVFTIQPLNPLFDADGSSLVVHAQADDYKTDPSGNSGARIACGVLTRGA